MIVEKFIKEINWESQTFETEDGEILPFVNEKISDADIIEPLDGIRYVYRCDKNNETE